MALNLLASGITVLIGQNWFQLGDYTPSLSGGARFRDIDLPLSETVKNAPFFGPLYDSLISGHSVLVYIAFACVPLTWWVLYRTRFGLRLRAVEENPGAVDTAGVSGVGLRYGAVLIAGVLCGIAGTYFSTALAAGFVKEMTAGRGYIALAALIFAKWRPWYALGATMLFGLLEALSSRYQSLKLGDIIIPGQVMDALPYILTVMILAGFVGKAMSPRAGGEPYVKER